MLMRMRIRVYVGMGIGDACCVYPISARLCASPCPLFGVWVWVLESDAVLFHTLGCLLECHGCRRRASATPFSALFSSLLPELVIASSFLPAPFKLCSQANSPLGRPPTCDCFIDRNRRGCFTVDQGMLCCCCCRLAPDVVVVRDFNIAGLLTFVTFPSRQVCDD